MPATPDQLVFCYDGIPAGYFKGGRHPTAAGRYRYEPFRSWGHLNLHNALRAGARPRCSFRAGRRVVSFAVVDCPEPGVLDLAEFGEEQVE